MRTVCVLLLLLSLPSASVQADEIVRAETRTDQVRAEYGLTGDGVLIAIFDRGIDYEHPDFRNPDGTTRILFIYDMLDDQGVSAPDNPTGLGTVYTRSEIDAALASETRLAHRDAVGHGTPTAGMAGGNGRASDGLYDGIAPGATFVIVKMVSEGAPAHGGEPAEPAGDASGELATALDFVLDRADEEEMPVVFLANFGSIQGPSDGTSAQARVINERFGPGHPGRVFITGTSDDGGHPNHAAGTVAQGETAEIQINKAAGFLRMDLWYDDTDRFDVEIVTPSGTFGPYPSPATNAQQDFRFVGGPSAFNYYHQGSDVDFFGATSPRREILLDLTGGAGDYTVRLTGASVTSGSFDAALNPARIFPGSDANRFESFVDVSSTVWDIATAEHNIAPNSYVVRENWTDVDGITRTFTGNDAGEGGLWPGSGVGPTYDGRLGVTVSAPGNSVFTPYAPRSFSATIRGNLLTEDRLYGVFSAVSGAAPVVTGIVALLLEADPMLDATEVEDVLQRTARADAFTGAVPNPVWGYGKIDAYAAVSDVLGTTDVAPAPTVAGLRLELAGPNPFGRTAFLSLTLPEASDLRVEVFDALGRRVALLQDGPVAAGPHPFTFDARGLPSGLYVVRAVTGQGMATRRLTLLR